MRTGRSLTVGWSLLPGGGGVCLVRGSGWCLLRGGWDFWLVRGGGVLPGRGVFLVETPPLNRMTDRCKNITLATTFVAAGVTCSNCLPVLPWCSPFLTVQNYPTLKYKGQRPLSLPTPLNTWAPSTWLTISPSTFSPQIKKKHKILIHLKVSNLIKLKVLNKNAKV